MRIWRVILLAVVVGLASAACSGDDDALDAFDVTGRVTSVEVDAQPANTPADSSVTGAILVRASDPALADCDDDGVVRIYVDEKTSFTPTKAADDLATLNGKTVRVSGGVTSEDDTCTPIADSVAVPGTSDNIDGTIGGSGDDGTGSGSTSSPSSAASPGGSASPKETPGPADEGSILDGSPSPRPPEETP